VGTAVAEAVVAGAAAAVVVAVVAVAAEAAVAVEEGSLHPYLQCQAPEMATGALRATLPQYSMATAA
jgi:hypothetical protein